MCIAALVKPGATVPDATLHKMANANRNGVGIGYVMVNEKGASEVCIEKGLFNSQMWVDKFRAIQKAAPDSPVLLHARIATLGRVTRDNCHPFNIKDGALIHNGMLWSSYDGYNALKSDTREFAERMHNNFVYEDIMFDKKAIEESISYNKIVLLFKDKRYIILNESLGEWRDDVWFSNHNYRSASSIACDVRT